MRTPVNAATYRPPHGGYPSARAQRRRILRGAGIARAGVVVNQSPPPAPGFGPGVVQEAYELGLAAGGGRR